MAQPQQVVYPPSVVFKLFDLESATNVFVPSVDSTGVFVIKNSDESLEFFRVDTLSPAVIIGGITPLAGIDPAILTYFTADQDSYSGINVVNINSGTTASCDIVAARDSADPLEGFVDMGITSSGNTDANFPILQGGNAYLWSASNDLVIGTGATDLILFAGGFETANIGATLAGTGGWTFSQVVTFNETITLGSTALTEANLISLLALI
jgi:hypothetical protein